MDSKKYLLISTEFPPYDGKASKVGGIGTWMYELAKNMAETGMTITVLASNKTTEDILHDKKQKFKTVRMSRKGWKNFKDLIIAWNLLKPCLTDRYDYVLLASIDLATAPLLLSKIFGFKVASFVHGRDLQKVSTNEHKKKGSFLKRINKVIVNSRFMKDVVLSYGIDENKIILHNPGIDTDRFNLCDDPNFVIDKFGLKDKFVLVTIGRVTQLKGQDTVIRSLPKVLNRVPNLNYLVVGDGKYRGELEYLVKELGLTDNVFFTGFIDYFDIVPYFKVADIFIMVSRSVENTEEGFGIVFIEANMCKKPVIAGRSGGMVDAVEDGITGLLVDPVNVNEVADAIVKLATDGELRKHLGEQGHKRAVEKFDYKKTLNKLAELLTRN